MKLSENPIQMTGLSKIVQLTGGHKGVLFLFENARNEKLVVKFQDEDPIEALAGTQIMQRAKASTPNVRKASRIDVANISLAVRSKQYELDQQCAALLQAQARFKHVLLMDFAEGSTLEETRRNQVEEFFAVPWGRFMGNQGVQWGSVAAAFHTYARKEAGLLFDIFLSSALSDHPDTQEDVAASVRSQRSVFVYHVTNGAVTAMQQLLAPGQNWAMSLRMLGAGDQLVAKFRIRKRLLRQMAAGEDPEDSLATARDPKSGAWGSDRDRGGMPRVVA